MPKRLIEDLLPLAELNKTAQTGGGIGSFNAMHPYFARRPLTASRAMTLAALVDAPADEQERKALERLVVELSQKEWPEHDARLDQARDLIRKAHGGRAPRVLDPFAGGGSMPLEAMRLGCEATALDLNPVAYLALIGSLVYPQKMTADRRPRIAEGKPATGDGEQKANDSQPQAANGGQEQWSLLKFSSAAAHSPPSTSHFPLVDDVRYWAEWVLTQAQARIGACYPNDPDGAIPTAYLWAKTVICPRCGGEVPLIKRFWLQQGERSEQSVAYRLQVDREAKTYTVEILRGALAQQAQPDQGTMRGATVECIYCGAPTERQEIAAQAQAGQMGQHLLALALSRSGESGRDFRAAGAADRAAFARAAQLLDEAQAEGYEFWGLERMLSVIPDEPTPPNLARSVSIRLYGVDSWGKMFNQRQLLALVTLGQKIREAREWLNNDNREYAQAIALYLSIILNRYITRSSVATIWDLTRYTINNIFARHDIQMTWDYAESNPFSGLAASWQSQLEAFAVSLENLLPIQDTQPASVHLGSATRLPEEWSGQFDAVICDPPYYDSVTYADLTDFFYPWHKRIVGDDYPEAFVTEVTPKDEELVQEAVYHGGSKSSAKQFYEDGMAQAFSEMQRVLRPDGVAVIMFAHKSSSAWETLVGALIRAGFQVTASWPLNTEGRRLQSYRAVALASSVYLVCRKRAPNPPAPFPAREGGGAKEQRRGVERGYLEDIQSDLRRTIRRYLERFWEAGIGGADFFMSAIGPGLSVFSRYDRVERYDGSQVTVSDFLDLARHEAAAFAIERIISADLRPGNASDGRESLREKLDQPTQFYLLWRWGYNDWDVPDGEAVLLSTAVGIDLKALMERFGLVEHVKGKLRLLSPSERRPRLERVSERVAAGGAVPLVDMLHKACLLWEADAQDELSALIAARSGEMWPVAQAMVELLPRDNAERKALMSMLGTRSDLESRAQRWVADHPARYKPQPRQLGLWESEE